MMVVDDFNIQPRSMDRAAVSTLYGRNPRRVQFAVKRAIDIVVSMGAFVFLAPALVLVIFAIKLDSGGPVFFRQKRWGKDNKVITVYKFRSMKTELGDPTGVAQTVENDPRVTRVGRFLRSSNVDELPQLFNVLRGDMSLIGPRCHALGMIAAGVLYEELVPDYHERHRMRPGITGLAQMRGLRGPTDTVYKARARVISDFHYIENFSLILDLKIALGTLRNEIFGGTGF